MLRAHLVRAVLGSGNFDWTDTRLTAAVFALLALSLAAQGLSLLLIRAYYAAGRTFVPFLVSCASAIVSVVLGFVLIAAFHNEHFLLVMQRLMRLEGIDGTDVLALGMAYAIANICGAVVLVFHFEHRFGGFFRRVSRAWWQGLVAALSAMITSYVVLNIAGPLDVGSTTLSVMLKGFAGGTSGLIVAGLAYWCLGSVEHNETVFAVYGRYIKHFIEPAQGVATATSAEDQPGQA